LIYLSLEKFTSIAPSTLTLLIIKAFSSEKLFENVIKKNIVVVKIIKIKNEKDFKDLGSGFVGL